MAAVALASGLLTMAASSGCATSGPVRGGGGGAPWTILCLEVHNPTDVAQLEQIADTLRRTPGIQSNKVFVMRRADGSAGLYYGSYRARTDRTTGKWTFPERLHRDLKLLRELGDESQRRYFFRALPARMPTPDVGDPAWSLARVRGYYTLQVGVFEPKDDFTDYKKAAVEFCRLLREHGHEAYYYHTPSSSMVTVGVFGPEAAIKRPDGHTVYSAPVRALQRDELLKHNLVNGAIMRVRDSEGDMSPVPSFLVEIPQSLD